MIIASTWASYRAVKESALEVGRERLLVLTQQLVGQSQQSLTTLLDKTSNSANDAAIRAFLQTPSSTTRLGAVTVLEQFSGEKDPGSLQVELWNADHTLALALPDGSSPEPADLESEFTQSAVDPFKAVGSLRVLKDIVAYPAIAAVKDDARRSIGFLVRWRRLSPTLNVRKRLADLLGSQAALYYGNSDGDIFTDLEKVVPKPPGGLHPTLEVTHYTRDGDSVMSLGRPIVGTPWFVVVEFPDQMFLSRANRFLRRIAGVGLVLFAIGVAVALALSRSIIDITERKRSEERFRQLIEHAPNGMVMVDQKGKMALVNAQIEKSFGYSREELLGQPIEKLVPQRFRANHSDYRDAFIANPSARPMGAGRDLYGLRRDGSEFPAEIGLNPLETEQGTMVLATIVDIAKRKQAEERLSRSQAQLAGVIASAMDAIISVDEEQRIVLFNTAAERMFLFPSEDAIGQPIDRFIPQRFRAAHKQHVEDFGQTHATRRSMAALGAIYGLRADGEEFPIETSISQMEAEGRRFYTVILRDITERKRSEEALKEQARILDLAPVLIRDLKGRILFWNSGSQQMYGWTPEEALERMTYSLLQTEFPRPLEEIMARLYAHGHWEGEVVHTRKDGELLVVASHWVLHRDEHDKPKAILEVSDDITERKQAEREIRRLNEELEQRVAERTAQLQAANKELETFSYSVSHDLRAPLRHINGFSQALLEDYADKLDQTAKGYLQEVRGASREMAELIDDLLELARVTRSEMREEAVDLSSLARGVVAELQARDRGRTVVVNIEEGLSIRGDKRLLRIVLRNLLGNAWKFTSKRKQPAISFAEAKDGSETCFFVRDNGAGFDMAYADKLFGAFQRLHTAREFEGTGIGLATVQRIVHRHGGRVWAEGTVNEGATFFFTLPDIKETGNGQ